MAGIQDTRLTIFAIPRAFRNGFDIIQRNAIRSWSLLRPRPEIVLFGDEPGTADVCADLGLRHEPSVALTKEGSPRLDDVLRRAQDVASFDLMCYVNADIILMSDLIHAIDLIQRWTHQAFLATGPRHTVPISALLEFDSGWEEGLKRRATEEGRRLAGLDYFVFRRGLYEDVPPFAIGRGYWSAWMVFHPRIQRIPVIDVSGLVTAIHHEHGYGYHAEGKGVKRGLESEANRRLLSERVGRPFTLFSIRDSSHVLTERGIAKPWSRKGLKRWLSRDIKNMALFHPALGLPLRPLTGRER